MHFHKIALCSNSTVVVNSGNKIIVFFAIPGKNEREKKTRYKLYFDSFNMKKIQIKIESVFVLFLLFKIVVLRTKP